MTLRPAHEADIPSIARVHMESWRTTYRGIVAEAHLASLSQEKHEQRHHRLMAQSGVFYRVAELPGKGIVGFLIGGPERTQNANFPGELYAVYLLARQQRRGIGKALVANWAQSLLNTGITSGLVWVLADNHPAKEFYQQLGGEYLAEQNIEIAGQSLRELAYGWNDLRTLAAGSDNE